MFSSSGYNLTSLLSVSNSEKRSVISDLITEYLVPAERKNWEKIVQAELFTTEDYLYRLLWGTKAYNAVFMPLGAGYNDTDYRVSSCAARGANCLAIFFCLIDETSVCFNLDNIDDFIHHRKGVKFPDRVRDTDLISDCCSNYARSVLMAPITSLSGAFDCFCMNLPLAMGMK